jgi:hypothetical protein
MTLGGRYIRHQRTMDVCFLVSKSYTFPHKTKLKGYWVNMGFKESYKILPGSSNIEIKTEDLKNWEVLSRNDEYIKCFRDGHWKPLISSSV